MKIIGIARETLEFILSVSKSSVPNEFAGLMQQTDGVITDIMILPGTESSDRNAVIKLFMITNITSSETRPFTPPTTTNDSSSAQSTPQNTADSSYQGSADCQYSQTAPCLFRL